KPCGVLLLDLDGFKSVNDTLGHEAGDRVLQQVGQRLRSVLRKADTIARYGGDEFAVVPWGATDVPRAVVIAEKLLQAVDAPFTIDDQPVNIKVSIGIAVFPQHADDAHGLLPPDDFIPSAEQTDLIKPLTAWVLNEALGQVHAWSKAGIDIGVSVNLSARNLLDAELPDAVAELLRTWQVPPEKLSLEIT